MSLREIGANYAEDPKWAMNVARMAHVDLDQPLYMGVKGKSAVGAAPPPPWLRLAIGEIGTKEVAGRGSNPVIEQYYVLSGAARMTDDVPWCAAFVGAVLKKAGIKPSGSLMARSYLNWGQPISVPKPGAIVVFRRGTPPQGHVAFFLKDEGRTISVVGGNQRDAVTIASYPKSRVLGYRWPSEGKQAMAKAMRKPKRTSRTRKKGQVITPTYMPPPTLITEVPVLNPNTTVSNAVGIGAAVTPLLLWLSQYFEVPLTADNIAVVMSAVSVLTGVFLWAKNRWFTAEATTTTAELKGLPIRME
jgi:uncharacterized protein (TIGR02594 family)